jgi:hypothetical protein
VRQASSAHALQEATRRQIPLLDQLCRRACLPHTGTDGTLQVRRLCIHTAIQFAANLAHHTASLNFSDGATRTEASQQVQDLRPILPDDHSSSTSHAINASYSICHERRRHVTRLHLREHEFQMNATRGERE